MGWPDDDQRSVFVLGDLLQRAGTRGRRDNPRLDLDLRELVSHDREFRAHFRIEPILQILGHGQVVRPGESGNHERAHRKRPGEQPAEVHRVETAMLRVVADDDLAIHEFSYSIVSPFKLRRPGASSSGFRMYPNR